MATSSIMKTKSILMPPTYEREASVESLRKVFSGLLAYGLAFGLDGTREKAIESLKAVSLEKQMLRRLTKAELDEYLRSQG